MKVQKKVCVIKDEGSCLRRSRDAEMVGRLLQKNDCVILPEDMLSNAEYVVVITCGFNDFAQRRCMEIINRVTQFVEEKNCLVLGCLPGIRPNYFSDKKMKILSPSEYEKLEEVLKNMGMLGDNVNGLHCMFDYGVMELEQRDANTGERIHYLDVASGCMGNCRYCAIRFAVGRLKSRSLYELKEEVIQVIRKGAKGIYLGADDLGAWGMDIGDTFPNLLKELLKIISLADPWKEEGIYIDLRNVVNARWIAKYKAELQTIYDEYEDRIPTLSIALQSGSDKVLKYNRRFDNTNEIMNALCGIYKIAPNIYGFGQVIIGLPGESYDDLKETIVFIIESPIQFWTCFKYSQTGREEENYDVDRVEKRWEEFQRLTMDLHFKTHINDDRIYLAKSLDQRYVKIQL